MILVIIQIIKFAGPMVPRMSNHELTMGCHPSYRFISCLIYCPIVGPAFCRICWFVKPFVL